MQRMSAVLVDANGLQRQVQFTTSGGAASVLSNVLAFSDADVSASWESALTINPTPAPVVAQFVSVLDAAILTFSTTGTELVQITIPAPQVSIFFADQETVDPSTIPSLIAVVIANVVSTAGNSVVAFVSGYRRRK